MVLVWVERERESDAVAWVEGMLGLAHTSMPCLALMPTANASL